MVRLLYAQERPSVWLGPRHECSGIGGCEPGILNLTQVPVSLLPSLLLIDKFPVPICRRLRPDAWGFRAFSRTRSWI
jgi:hypothetical protein